MPPFEIREATAEDFPDFTRLTQLAFGSVGVPTSEREWTPYVAVGSDGRVLGTAADLHHRHWWGGRQVNAADVSHVAVRPEAHGRGIARALMSTLLDGGRARGAAVSTLFATVAAVYRSLGWGAVGTRLLAEYPTAILPSDRPDPGLEVRAGRDEDRAAAGELYTVVARNRNGMQCREVAPWGPSGYYDVNVDELMVVEEHGSMAGFAAWNRGRGHGADSVLTVVDMIATSPRATRALLGALASWRAVAPTIRFRAIQSGPVANELPIEKAKMNRIDPLMHRIVDVPRAVAERGWPDALEVGATFQLTDHLAPWNSGTWDLEISGGVGQATRSTATSGIHLDAQGLALLLTGAMTPPMLVETGVLSVDAGVDLASLTSLATGPRAESLDFF